MRIIIDGADCVGKTAYCEKLAFDNKLNVYHFTRNSSKKTINYIIKMLLNNNTVFDRSFISEVIYSNYYDRKTKVNLKLLLLFCKLMKIKIIICTADDTKIREIYNSKYFEINKLSDILAINRDFILFSKKHNLERIKDGYQK